MHRFLRAAGLVAMLCAAGSVASAERSADPAPHPTRTRSSLNDGWRYAAGPLQDAASPSLDDAGWERVALPHTWNAEDAFDKRSTYRRGEGWYRRTLALTEAERGRRVFVFFEGANQVAELFVNGVSAGTHVGGYTAFVFDVTGLVRFEADNLLAVRVDNSHHPDIPPLEADFTFYGGIYRDVWLLTTDPVHVDVLDHAAPGIFVDTPDASAARATVRVRGALVNRSDETRTLQVTHRIFDPDDVEVSVLHERLQVPPGGRMPFVGESPPIASPRLWSPAQPRLYRAVTEVSDGARLLDHVEATFGIRWFAFDAQRGFFLNGRPLKLNGSNRHQDMAGRGNALGDDAHRRDVRMIRDDGFNFLRLAHYPQDPAVLDEADRAGLVVWEEIPVVNLIGTSPQFADNAERMLVEMIRQHYNHPSVLMWGYMNEVMQFRPKPEPPGYEATLLALARRLEARARAEDPTRATATAISLHEIDNGSGFQDIPQILGLNLYFGWYYQQLESLGPYLDDFHARHPERPLIVSEYGADSDERVHADASVAFDFSTGFQQRFHEANFAQIQARPYLLGSAVWNHFDFGSAGRQDTKYGLNQKGLYQYDRAPKDILGYYRARLLDAPVLHIAARESTLRAGSRAQDARQTIVVYGNADDIELLHDGVSLGRMQPRNATARFAVRLGHGANLIEARGRRDGQALHDAVIVHYEDRAPLFSGDATAVRAIMVNAGGAYSVTIGATVWEPDRAYASAGWGHVGGQPVRTHHRIHGTSDDPLWQATRAGVAAYRFDVPDGDYELEMGFIEIEHERPGARVFDVSVNGKHVISGLDLAKTSGRYVPLQRQFRVRAVSGRGVVVGLDALVGATTISTLVLRRR